MNKDSNCIQKFYCSTCTQLTTVDTAHTNNTTRQNSALCMFSNSFAIRNWQGPSLYFRRLDSHWRSHWPRGVRCRSAAARLLVARCKMLVCCRSLAGTDRIPPKARMSVSWECYVLSGSLCEGLITRPEVSQRLWSVWVWSWSLDNEEALAH